MAQTVVRKFASAAAHPIARPSNRWRFGAQSAFVDIDDATVAEVRY
jgi:hypothetical protein